MLRVDYVNDPCVIAQQTKMTAINSCVEVDLTGQISSDSIGTRMFSGFGGQMDFIAGAAMCKDGVPIIALRSTTNKGGSKIVPTLIPGKFKLFAKKHEIYFVSLDLKKHEQFYHF